MATVNSTEPNDTFHQANAVKLGDTITGSLYSGTDWDIYKVTLSSSGILHLDMSASQLSDWAYTVQVYDASYKMLGASALGYVANASFSVGAQAAGTYYIAVTSNNIYSGLPYSITPSLGSGSASDYEIESNDTLQTATAVSLDHIISGQQQSSIDIDNFSFNLASAGLLSLDFKVPEKLDYAYYQVNIYDSLGNLVDQKTSGSSFSLLESIAGPGKYTVQVKQSAAAVGYEGGNYIFLAHLDSGLSPSTTAVLTEAAPVKASINSATQTDCYKVDLKAGASYEFSLSGVQSGGGTLADCSLLLCTADGKVLETYSNLPTWSSGETVQTANPQIALTAPYTGTYYLRVAGFGGTGSYTLQQKTDSLQNLIVSLTGNASTQEHWALIAGSTSPLSLSYSFLTSTASGEVGFKAMTDSQKQAVRSVLAEYSSVTNINFKEVSDPSLAQISYGTSDQHNISAGVTYTTTNADGTLRHANVFINNTASASGGVAAADNMVAGQFGLEALIHETGHALGLKHPGDYNGLNGTGTPPFMPAAWDNSKFSVMSYIDNPDTTVYGQTPGMLDIAALQTLYGTRQQGAASTFSFSNSTEFKATTLGSGLGNILDLSNQTADCVISLTPGTFSSVGLKQDGTLAHDNLAIPFGFDVGKLVAGSGNDYIVGKSGKEIIYGGAGNDTFVGLAGDDAIYGGTGTDKLLLNTTAAATHLMKLRAGAIIVSDKSSGNLLLCRDIEQIKFSDSNVDVASVTPYENVDSALTQIYVAAFRRAPETGGYNYWEQEKAAKGMAAVADIIFSLDVVKAIYPASLSSTQFVSAIYQNVFNRSPDTEGLNYWVQQLAGKSRGQLVIDMTNAALTVPDGTSGKDYFQNRIDWALYAVSYQADNSTPLTPDHLTTLTAGISDNSAIVATLIGQAEAGVVI